MKSKETINNFRHSGFTLIELLVAMAVIAILSAVLLVGMQGFGEDARESKALTSLSSVIPSMVSCWGNGGKVNSPVASWPAQLTTDRQICDLSPSYGYWPQTVGNLSDYSYYRSNGNPLNSGTWFFTVTSLNDDVSLCCNQRMSGCKVLGVYLQRNSCSNNTEP